MGFGTMLIKLRERSKLTQAQLADRAGISLRTIQGWEQGHRRPVSEDFFKLTRALGVSADEFAAMDETAPVPRKMRGSRQRKAR
jgi:transcriptional regulator with XRE-family HTH domain